MLALKGGSREAGKAKNGKAGTLALAEADINFEAHQERRQSNAKASTSDTAAPSQQKSAAQDKKRKQPPDKATDVQPHVTDNGAAGDVQPASRSNHLPKGTGQSAAAPAHKLTKVGSASITDDSTEAVQPPAASNKPGIRQHSSQVASLPPFALPGSASTPSALSRLPSQTSGMPGGTLTSSTRISLPPKLTQLTSLRSKLPVQELQQADDSPDGSDTEAEEAAAAGAAAAAAGAAAAAAAVEAHLKGVTQQFDALLQNTLQRTKDSVHKVTQFAVRAAAGKHGKTAAHRLVIMILDLIETAQMSKRVDLFYLLDSLLQVGSSCSWTEDSCLSLPSRQEDACVYCLHNCLPGCTNIKAFGIRIALLFWACRLLLILVYLTVSIGQPQREQGRQRGQSGSIQDLFQGHCSRSAQDSQCHG